MSEMSNDADAIEAKAIEILGEGGGALSYRDLVSRVMLAMPEAPRHLVSVTLGELPKTRGDAVWRPKPGTFKLRGENEGPAQYARGRKRKHPEPEAKPVWPERPLPNRIENLVKLGFAQVGEWRRTISGIECVYSVEVDLKRALLAYVVSDTVVFIGREAGGGGGYVGRSIRNALARNKGILVFALTDWEPCTHKGMDVNVAAGIEDELVERMQPPWNSYA
jgi:hypothetical protein